MLTPREGGQVVFAAMLPKWEANAGPLAVNGRGESSSEQAETQC